MEIRQPLQRGSAFSERRGEPRWRDTRLLTLQLDGDEVTGITGDISSHGMAVRLPKSAPPVGTAVIATVAFAQDLVDVEGRLVYVQPGDDGVVVGIRFGGETEDLFSRFVKRRYYA